MTTDTDTQEIAVDEWLSDKGITFKLVGHGVKIDAERWQHHSYTATFERDGRKLSTPFMAGMGHHKDPEAIVVLYSLLVDKVAGEMSFDEFVSDFGYDIEEFEDEMKVRKTYNACQSLGKQMGKFFTDDEVAELEELTRDY